MHYDAEALAQKINAHRREAKKELELKAFENQFSPLVESGMINSTLGK
ncbi:MAG: hypothetical protein ABL925_04460 [Methylococcales bacterium]